MLTDSGAVAESARASCWMSARAMVGVPMKRMQPDMPTMPPAEPTPVAMPKAPSFSGSALVDAAKVRLLT